jgi:sporulation protein YlmC with PRC-barrel domain
MSKAKLIGLGVAVAALAATPAFAQTSTSPSTTRPSTSAPEPSGSSTRAAMPSDISQMKASDLIGKNVYNASDERIGEIDDVVVRKSGNGTMAVIGVGGFLGIGEKKAAVPLDQLKVQGDKIVGASLSKEQLKAQAEYKATDYDKVDRDRVVGENRAGSPSSPSGSSSTGSSGTMGSGSYSSPSGGSAPSGASNAPSTGSGTSSDSGTMPKQQ